MSQPADPRLHTIAGFQRPTGFEAAIERGMQAVLNSHCAGRTGSPSIVSKANNVINHLILN